MIGLYTTGGRMTGRVTCSRVGQEIPVVLMENHFSIKITDEDDNPIRFEGDDFDFLFRNTMKCRFYRKDKNFPTGI